MLEEELIFYFSADIDKPIIDIIFLFLRVFSISKIEIEMMSCVIMIFCSAVLFVRFCNRIDVVSIGWSSQRRVYVVAATRNLVHDERGISRWSFYLLIS